MVSLIDAASYAGRVSLSARLLEKHDDVAEYLQRGIELCEFLEGVEGGEWAVHKENLVRICPGLEDELVRSPQVREDLRSLLDGGYSERAAERVRAFFYPLGRALNYYNAFLEAQGAHPNFQE